MRRGLRGFSLIEVLVTVLIVAFGVLGMLSLSTAALKDLRAARLQQRAVDLTADLTARLRGSRPSTAPGRGGTAPELSEWRERVALSLPGGLGDVVMASAAGTTEYIVTVSWLSSDTGRSSHAVRFMMPLGD